MDDASAYGPNSTQPLQVVPNRGASDPVGTRAQPMTAGIQSFEHRPRGDSAQDRSAATADLSRDVSAGTMADGADMTATGSDFLVSRSPSPGEMHHRHVDAGALNADDGGVFDNGKKTGALAVDEEEPDAVRFRDDEDAESLKSPRGVGKSLTFGGVTVARAAALNEEPEESMEKSVRRTLCWLLLRRLPLAVLLVVLVVLTSTQWWMARPSDIVLMQQVLTAAVGLIIGVLVREFTFMAQGALAATWAFRKHKSSLPVAEAIQFGNPALLINSAGVSPFDIGVVVMLPVLAVLFNVIYKFGITVENNTSPWTGLIRTVYLAQDMDTRSVMTDGCRGVVDRCKVDILQTNFSFANDNPASLTGYSAPGIVYGHETDDKHGYTLVGGDVPQIDEAFKANVVGMAYKQVLVNTTVDCSNSVDPSPRITSCPFFGGLTTNGTELVTNVTYCPPISNVLNMSLTFTTNTSLPTLFSCLLTSSVWLRDVVATPDLDSWAVTQSSASLSPLNASTLAATQHELMSAMVSTTTDEVHTDPPINCFGPQGLMCPGQTPHIESAVASVLAVDFTVNIFKYLHNHVETSDTIAVGDSREPLPGRLLFKGDGRDPWVEVLGPVGVVNFTATPNYTSIVAANAGTRLVKNQYVTLRPWLLALLLLPLVELIMALVKFMYRAHPFEPVCGFVWTIRKVNAKVATDANGLSLRQVLAYARNLKLDWKDDDEGPLALSLARSRKSF
ncbi:hypothetical protein HK101_009982 [Irineochytrium annulatum]|nr:hypothetical protein HK101_009982 [Irineochytrium annulatum]